MGNSEEIYKYKVFFFISIDTAPTDTKPNVTETYNEHIWPNFKIEGGKKINLQSF